MNLFTCTFQGFCPDFKSFVVVFKTFQSTYFPEHLFMAASVCVETVLLRITETIVWRCVIKKS